MSSTLRVETLATLDGSVSLQVSDLANAISLADVGVDTFTQQMAWRRQVAGAVERTVFDKLADVVHIADYGGKGDGVFNNTAAFNAALADALNMQYCRLKFGPGVYVLDDDILIALSGIKSLVIEGEGDEVTQLLWNNGTSGIKVTAPMGSWWLDINPSPRFGLHNLAMVTTNLNGGIGLDIDMGAQVGRPTKRVSLENVTFRGRTLFGEAWATATKIRNTCELWASKCRWMCGGSGNTVANGIDIAAVASQDGSIFNFDHCESYYGNAWILAGDHVEGIYLTQCTSVGTGSAVRWVTTTGESGLHIIGGHYNNFIANFFTNNVFDVVIMGALLFGGSTGGGMNLVRLDNAGRFVIQGNQFAGGAGVNENAILIANSPGAANLGGMIDGNNFNHMTATAILLDATSKNVTVTSTNTYNGNTLNLVDNGVGNKIHSKVWSKAQNVTLAGGSTSENVTIAVPAGFFSAAPDSAEMTCDIDWTIGFYNRTLSTATSLVFATRWLSGATMANKTIEMRISAKGR